MISVNAIAWDDTVLPFQLDRSDIRGRVARLDGVLEGILKQHDYPPVVEALVAEMALLTALIGQTVKLRWKLSLQVQSNGPVRMIATDYYGPSKEGEPARIRAYASYDAARLSGNNPFDQLGEGYFAIMIDQGQGMQPYKGITPLAGGTLRACAESYFAQSEQLPTRFNLSFGRSTEPGEAERWRAGGIMLQHMPKASPADIFYAATTDGRSWRPQVIEAELRARAGRSAFVYQVDFRSPTNPDRGAFHGIDIALVFGTIDGPYAWTGNGTRALSRSATALA